MTKGHAPLRANTGRRALATAIDSFGVKPHLLSATFPCERLLCASLVARLQIEGVLLDILNDVFRLNLSLKSAKGAFN